MNDCPGRDGKSNWGNPDFKDGKGDKILSGGVNLLDGGWMFWSGPGSIEGKAGRTFCGGSSLLEGGADKIS